MRILLVTPYFYPHKGGSQQYAEELHYHLMKADPAIHVDVLCYNTDHAKEFEKYRGFHVYRVPCIEVLRGQFAIPNYFKLWKLLKMLFFKHSYAFINSHTRFFESSWWVPYVARHFKTKSVLTDHCAFHPVHTSRIVSFIAKTFDKTIIPFFANQYDVVTVTNKATLAFAKSLGIKKPQLIYGGVDTDYFNQSHKKDSQEKIRITFVGRMIESKGPQLLYEAAQNILKENKNVSFIFAGGGPMITALSKNRNKNITLLGSVEKSEVGNILKQSDIVVHPSLHHEGFPNVLLEAGAAGSVVIATDRGGTKEIIIHNKTGIIVEPRVADIQSSIETLIADKSKRDMLGKNLRNHIEKHFSWKKIVVEYQNLISKAL